MNILGWPFSVVVEGALEGGSAATVTIDSSSPPTEETIELQRYVVESFAGFAAAGGLGGDRVSPMRSTAALGGNSLGALESTLATWQLANIAIDARSLVVLFNALAFLVDGITHVAVQAQGAGP